MPREVDVDPDQTDIDFAKVAFARVNLDFQGTQSMFEITDELIQALAIGTMVIRYQRIWHMGRHVQRGNRIFGRIGYQKSSATSQIWDDSAQDFIETPQNLGKTIPFLIDLETLRVVFQLRGTEVKPLTFAGNFEALLREASSEHWNVELEFLAQPSWENWVQSIDRLFELRVKNVIPNPRYRSDRIEEAFNSTKASEIEYALKALEGESLDLESEGLIKDAIEHSKRYGSRQAKGFKQTDTGPVTETWKSDLEGEYATLFVEQDPVTLEVTETTLNEALDTRFPRQT